MSWAQESTAALLETIKSIEQPTHSQKITKREIDIGLYSNNYYVRHFILATPSINQSINESLH